MDISQYIHSRVNVTRTNNDEVCLERGTRKKRHLPAPSLRVCDVLDSGSVVAAVVVVAKELVPSTSPISDTQKADKNKKTAKL